MGRSKAPSTTTPLAQPSEQWAQGSPPHSPGTPPLHGGTRVCPSQKHSPAATHAADCLPTHSPPTHLAMPTAYTGLSSSPNTRSRPFPQRSHEQNCPQRTPHLTHLHICRCDCLLPAHTHTHPGRLDPLALNMMFLEAHGPLRKTVGPL